MSRKLKSWLARLFNTAWRLGSEPKGWQTGVGVYLFKKWDPWVFNYRGITLFILTGKVYSRMLERRVCSDCQTLDGRETMQILSQLWNNRLALYYSRNPGGGLGIFMGFVDLEKAYDQVPQYIETVGLWGEGGTEGNPVSVHPK